MFYYPPEIKDGNGKVTVYVNFPLKPPFIVFFSSATFDYRGIMFLESGKTQVAQVKEPPVDDCGLDDAIAAVSMSVFPGCRD